MAVGERTTSSSTSEGEPNTRMSVNQDDDHARYEHLFETPPRMGPARERPPSWDPESSLTAASTPSHRSNYHEETAPLQESPIPSYPLFSPSYAPETTASLRQPPAHAEPEPERSRRPSNLFPMRNQHRPDYWTFVRLVPKPAYAHLAVDDLVTDHAQAAYCLRCESCIPFRKGQNGVKKHMVKFHMEHLATYAKDKAKKREAEVTLTNSYSQSDPQSESKGVAVSPQQQSHVNELLALWIAGSLRPLSTVSDKGFSALIRYLTSDLGGVEVRLPSRTQVRADIAQQAAELRASLKNKLAKECGYYSVTTDIWTSRTARSFLALTVHYLTLQFQLCNWTLEVEHFPGRHSGAAIAEGLTSLLKRWGLDLANCTKLLRDGASNGVLAGNLLGIEHMSCIAHSLHLVLAGLLIKKRPTPSDASAVGASNARTPSVMIADHDPLRMQQPPEEDAGRATTTQTDNAWFEEPTETEAVPWQRERAWCELGDFLQTWVQLEERSAMGEVRDIVQRFRTIAVYFHKSPKAWNRLAEIQIERQARRPLRPITDCPTRWNSARDMLARMMELEVATAHFFTYLATDAGKKEFKDIPSLSRPAAADWFTARCLVALLDPIAATTEVLSGEKYPTLSVAFPCLRAIRATLAREDLFAQEAVLTGPQIYREAVLERMHAVRRILLNLFDRRFAELPDELMWVSLLDPRLTDMSTLSPDEAIHAKDSFVAAVIEIAGEQQPSSFPAVEELQDKSPVPKRAKMNVKAAVFGKRATRKSTWQADTDSRERSMRVRCEAEVHRYLACAELASVEVDPLDWWQRHATIFPTLALLARKWLACVATSVPSERAFSTAGNTVTAQRSSLETGLVRDVVFIHENFVSS